MCEAVRDDSSSLQFVADWFVSREGVHMGYDDCSDNDDGDYWVTGDDDVHKFTIGIKNAMLKKHKLKNS